MTLQKKWAFQAECGRSRSQSLASSEHTLAGRVAHQVINHFHPHPHHHSRPLPSPLSSQNCHWSPVHLGGSPFFIHFPRVIICSRWYLCYTLFALCAVPEAVSPPRVFDMPEGLRVVDLVRDRVSQSHVPLQRGCRDTNTGPSHPPLQERASQSHLAEKDEIPAPVSSSLLPTSIILRTSHFFTNSVTGPSLAAVFVSRGTFFFLFLLEVSTLP